MQLCVCFAHRNRVARERERESVSKESEGDKVHGNREMKCDQLRSNTLFECVDWISVSAWTTDYVPSIYASSI